MPNRIIKESICYSEDINNLTPEEEVFFYRLMVNCDDFGRCDARTQILKARLYPLKEKMKSDDIKRYLKKLSDMKMIILYCHDNITYLQLTKWERHQQVRAKWSKYPAPADVDVDLITSDINCNQTIAYVPENPNPNPKYNPKYKYNPSVDDVFEQLWKLYPKKEGKGQISKTQKSKLCEIGLEEMTRAIERYKNDKGHLDRQYLKQGSTFFNSGYIDYLDENYSPPETYKPKTKAELHEEELMQVADRVWKEMGIDE